MGTDGFGFGRVCFVGCQPVIPSKGGTVLSCTDTQNCLFNGLKILLVEWGRVLALDIMDGN